MNVGILESSLLEKFHEDSTKEPVIDAGVPAPELKCLYQKFLPYSIFCHLLVSFRCRSSPPSVAFATENRLKTCTMD